MDLLADLPDDHEEMPPSRRGVARKNQIIDAALSIIGSDGIAGLSMRGVAAQAGLPLGAVGYYFRSKDDLIAAAFQRHTRRETKRVVRTISQLGVGQSYQEFADKLADFVISGLTESRDQLFAEYQFMLESSRRRELEHTSSAWQQSLISQLQVIVTALGSPSPKLDSRLILAVLAGLEIDHLAMPLRPADQRTIRAVLARHFEVLFLSWSGPEAGASRDDEATGAPER